MRSRSSTLSWSNLRSFMYRESTALPNVEQLELTRPYQQSDSKLAPALLSWEEPQESSDHTRKWRIVVRRLSRSIRWLSSVPALVVAKPPIALPTSTPLAPSDISCKHTLYPASPNWQLSPPQRATNKSTPGRRLAVDYRDLSCDLAWRSLICALQYQREEFTDQPEGHY